MIVWNDSITTIQLSVEANRHEPLGYQTNMKKDREEKQSEPELLSCQHPHLLCIHIQCGILTE